MPGIVEARPSARQATRSARKRAKPRRKTRPVALTRWYPDRVTVIIGLVVHRKGDGKCLR
jgi:hypothetical protein